MCSLRIGSPMKMTGMIPSLLHFLIVATLTMVTACSGTSSPAFDRSVSVANRSNHTCKVVARCLKQLDMKQECDIFPVPERFEVPLPAPGSFLLNRLRDDVWVYSDGAFQSLILSNGRRLAVVDFPDTPASSKPDGSMTLVTDAVEQVLKGLIPTRIDLVYSHNHYDHIGGGARFYNYVSAKFSHAAIFIWGTAEARRVINLSPSKRALPPNMIVGKRGRTLSLGSGLEVRMQVLNGHTSGDLLLYIPRQKDQASLLMTVDIIFPGWSPFLNMAVTDDLGRYIEAHREVLKFDFDIFIAGHFRIGARNDVIRNLRFTQDLVNAGAAALRAVTQEELLAAGIGKFFDPSSIAYSNPWFAFIGVTRRLQVDMCFRIMLEKWGCKIAGLDFTLRSHCFTSVQYNAFDL